MAYISKGIEMYYKGVTEATSLPTELQATYDAVAAALSEMFVDGTATALGRLIPNLQEIGDLGSGASAERDKIEVTTLADDKHVYTDGLLTDSEFDSIDFKLLYTPKDYASFIKIIEWERALSVAGVNSIYSVRIPNLEDDKSSVFTIKGVTAIKLDGTSYNGALTMTLTLTPKEEVEFSTLD